MDLQYDAVQRSKYGFMMVRFSHICNTHFAVIILRLFIDVYYFTCAITSNDNVQLSFKDVYYIVLFIDVSYFTCDISPNDNVL